MRQWRLVVVGAHVVRRAFQIYIVQVSRLVPNAGAWWALHVVEGRRWLMRTHVPVVISAACLLPSLAVVMSWRIKAVAVPAWLAERMYPLDKTSRDVLRPTKLLATAVLVRSFCAAEAGRRGGRPCGRSCIAGSIRWTSSASGWRWRSPGTWRRSGYRRGPPSRSWRASRASPPWPQSEPRSGGTSPGERRSGSWAASLRSGAPVCSDRLGRLLPPNRTAVTRH